MSSLLISKWRESFQIEARQLNAYLASVGGGHPVHSSKELAVRAGFKSTPLPGIQIVGAALAVLTRQMAAFPIKLLDVNSNFLHPILPGDEIHLTWLLDPDSVKETRRYIEGQYTAACELDNAIKAATMHIRLRVVVHG
ncbi:MAG: hypothetical protein EPN62_02805 [Candidimonas sp.]|nr:MAG: hypothetical protein EPN77_01070 [Candidimonas sp.]TAM25956.1 MAG: hypothetical protein EPN62_02805 [Candidimonas sp.]